MRIFDSRIETMTYNADFGRVEASVALVVKRTDDAPLHRMRLRTSQPVAGTGPLEERLTRDAIRLATALAH